MKEFNWDAIPVKLATGANPAAGANHAVITVPAGVRWQFLGWSSQLVTDATVANRYIGLYIRTSGALNRVVAVSGNAHTASLTIPWIFAIGMNVGTSSTLSAAGTTSGLGSVPIELNAGDTIQQTTGGLVAGDDWTAATYFYKEALA